MRLATRKIPTRERLSRKKEVELHLSKAQCHICKRRYRYGQKGWHFELAWIPLLFLGEEWPQLTCPNHETFTKN